MRVLCVGYPKTGTKSMREALDILGYKNIQDHFEQMIFGGEIIENAWFKNQATRKEIEKAFCNIDAVMDYPATLYWEKIFEVFGDAKVILMVRDDEEKWVKSYKNMIDTFLTKSPMMKYYKYYGWMILEPICPVINLVGKVQNHSFKQIAGIEELNDFCDEAYEKAKQNYLQHNKDVIFKCPREQLLIFNAKEGWAPLCKFLEKPIPNVSFPMRNVNHSLLDEVYSGTVKFDGGFSQILNTELRNITIFWTFSIVAVLSFFVKYIL